MLIFAGQIIGSQLIGVDNIEVDIVLAQPLDNLQIAVSSGQMERRLTLARLHVQRSTVVVEDLQAREVIVSRAQMYRKIASGRICIQQAVVIVSQELNDRVEAVLACYAHERVASNVRLVDIGGRIFYNRL